MTINWRRFIPRPLQPGVDIALGSIRASATLARNMPTAAGIGAGIVLGTTLARALPLTRLMLYGAQRPLSRTPRDLGLAYEDVAFTAADDVQLRGWFVPATPQAATVVLVHGWPWNRSGNRAGELPLPDRDVDYLAVAASLHQAGFQVLMFDLRNHGTSQRRPPVTFGLFEARDVTAAVAYLRSRSDVDGARIGALACSMGANAVIFAAPDIQLRAAILVQPVRVGPFTTAFSRALLGPAGPLLAKLADPLPRLLGGPALHTIDPTAAAALLGETETLFVQGGGDAWASVAEIEAMAARAPHARPLLVVPSQERYGGYQFVTTEAAYIAQFFRETLGG